MSEDNINITDSDNQIFQDQVRDVLLALASKMEERLSEYEQRLEALDKQIATLVIGFGEQAVFMDALIGNLSFATSEAQDAFHKSVADARRQMLEIMKEGADGLLASSDPDLASAIINMADEKLSD